MSFEEIKEYNRLDDIFQEDCCRVVEVLSSFQVYTKPWYNDIRYAERFSIIDDKVAWEGEDREHDHISGTFPAKYLTMTNKEVMDECEKINEEYLKKLEREKEEEYAREHERKLEQYLALKKELEL